MPWQRLHLAEDDGTVAELMSTFAAAWERGAAQGKGAVRSRGPATGMGAACDGDAAAGYARMPEGLRLLVGHPIAARVVAPDVKRSRRWCSDTRKESV
jgi:hypothetical protein